MQNIPTMKSTLLVITILIVTFLSTSAQPEGMILDKTNPIKKYEQIELKNGVVALEIHFNFIPKLGITAYSFFPTIKGIVKWENGEKEAINPKKYWFEDKFIVEMMTNSQEEIKNFNNEKKWEKINIQELSIKAKYSDSSVINYQLPEFSLARPIQKTPQITASFDAEGSIIGHSNNQIVLTVSVSPNNRTYQLIDLEIENKERLSHKFQPDAIFSQQGGVIKVPLNLKFTPKTELYTLKGTIKDIRSGNKVPFSGKVVLFDNRTLQTLAVKAEPDFHIKENDQIKIMVPTVGKGELELKIASVPNSIVITPEKIGENFHSFTLSNLLKEENHKIDFFFQVDGNRLKETYTIDKIIPLVSILDIENIEDKTKCKIEFKLPTWVSKKRLKVAVGNDVLIKGDNFKTEVNGDITTYTVVFGNTQSQGKIVEDVVKLPFYVMLDDTPISTKIQAKFVNKKVIEEIKEKLETEAQKPKGQRNQENINKWVTKAKDLGIALGQSLDDGDLNTAINGMNNPNKTKAQKTVEDIIKWVTAIAGVVLMVI